MESVKPNPFNDPEKVDFFLRRSRTKDKSNLLVFWGNDVFKQLMSD